MHFDGRQGDAANGVEQRDRGMGKGAGIDDNSAVARRGPVDELHQLALMVALAAIDVEAEIGAPAAAFFL